jgi:rod shape-determining protein MreC
MFFDLLRKYRITWLLGAYVLVSLALVLSERRTPIAEYGTVGSVSMRGVVSSQSLATSGVASISGFWDTYLDLVNVRASNEVLRAELERLREEHARLLGVMQENARLRALVGFTESYPSLELVPARIVGRDVSSFFRVTSIDIEVDAARVTVGMPVVASAGVVGHIAEVDGSRAEVVLAVDPRSSIDVIVQRNRARGIAVGLGHSNDYSSRLAYLLRRDEVLPGDVVVTSGVGGRFPPDLVVGRIAVVDTAEQGLFQEVTIEPAVDFSRLEEVFVVVAEVR